MIWLLAQIGLCLLLAAIAGWFVGWHLRAFRDQDRIEDLRQTMLATKDVNERELSESRKRVEELEARLARGPAPATAPVAAGGSAEARRRAVGRPESEPLTGPVPLAEVPPEATTADSDEPQEAAPTHVAAAERDRRREAEAALRRKTAAVLSLQAELDTLREAVSQKANEIAGLEDQLATRADPGERPDAGEVAALQARLRVLEDERGTLEAAAAETGTELAEHRKQLAVRDTRINDLRNRCGALETEIVQLREAARSASNPATERELAETRRALQRQIERNRKQEAVHRAVVEQFEAERAQRHAPLVAPVVPTVESPPQRSDELTKIRGIGPAFAQELREAGVDTYAQIAAWTDADVERIAEALSTHRKRIRTDEWIEQARKLARESRAARRD
jgi:predicted flap endonuclease-1-like 5' DNA nuclease